MPGNDAVDRETGSFDLPFGRPFDVSRMLVVPVIGEFGKWIAQPAQVAALLHHPGIFQELGMGLVLLRFIVPEMYDRQILRRMQVDCEPFVCGYAMNEVDEYADRAVRCDLVLCFQQVSLRCKAGIFLEFAKFPLELQVVFVNAVGIKDLPRNMPARDSEAVFIHKKQCSRSGNDVAPCVISNDKVNRTGKLIYFFNSINKHKELAAAISN